MSGVHSDVIEVLIEIPQHPDLTMISKRGS